MCGPLWHEQVIIIWCRDASVWTSVVVLHNCTLFWLKCLNVLNSFIHFISLSCHGIPFPYSSFKEQHTLEITSNGPSTSQTKSNPQPVGHCAAFRHCSFCDRSDIPSPRSIEQPMSIPDVFLASHLRPRNGQTFQNANVWREMWTSWSFCSKSPPLSPLYYTKGANKKPIINGILHASTRNSHKLWDVGSSASGTLFKLQHLSMPSFWDLVKQATPGPPRNPVKSLARHAPVEMDEAWPGDLMVIDSISLKRSILISSSWSAWSVWICLNVLHQLQLVVSMQISNMGSITWWLGGWHNFKMTMTSEIEYQL